MKFLLETENGLDFGQRTGLVTYGKVNVHNGETNACFYLIPLETIYSRTAIPAASEIEQRIQQACTDFTIGIVRLLVVE